MSVTRAAASSSRLRTIPSPPRKRRSRRDPRPNRPDPCCAPGPRAARGSRARAAGRHAQGIRWACLGCWSCGPASRSGAVLQPGPAPMSTTQRLVVGERLARARGHVSPTSRLFMVPALAAGIPSGERPGEARRSTTSTMRWRGLDVPRAETAAGGRAFTIVPSGATTSRGPGTRPRSPANPPPSTQRRA